MTTNHHTQLPFGGPLTSVAMEAPLGQLDAAIATVIATGSGTSTTLTAQALAGQASLTVASSTGFVVGDPIYIGTGATFESRIVATVPNGTTITVTVNLSNTYAIGKPVSKSPVEIVDARAGFTSLGGRIGTIEARVYDVKVYGAVGDDVANDRAAIQAAIDACSTAGGGEVYIPRGTYKVNTALQLKSKVWLRGAGTGSVLHAGADVDVVNAATVDAVVDAGIRDLKILGFGVTGTLSRGVHLNSALRVVVSNVWVDEASLDAIRLSASGQCRVLDCRVTNNRGALYPAINIITGLGNIVRGCETSLTSWVGIGLQNTHENLIEGNFLRGAHTGVNVYQASHRNRVIGNDCQTSGAGVTVDGDTSTAERNLVQGNHCHGNAAAGISVNNAPYTSVVGNYCHANLGSGAPSGGIYVVNSSQTQIVGNYCNGNTFYGIRVLTTTHRITISGNFVFGNGEDGIRVASSNHVAITGNTVYSNAKHGIYNQGGGYGAITGNTVTDNGTLTDNTYAGIVVDASRNVISGNTSVNSVALGSQAYGIRVASGTNNCVTGNVCFQNETANLSDLGTTTALSNNVTT